MFWGSFKEMNKRKSSRNDSKENTDPLKVNKKRLKIDFQTNSIENKTSKQYSLVLSDSNKLLNGKVSKKITANSSNKTQNLIEILNESETINKKQVNAGIFEKSTNLCLNFFDSLSKCCLGEKENLLNFILTTFSLDNLGHLLDEIIKDYTKIESSAFVISLFEYQIKLLEQSILKVPKLKYRNYYSW